MKKRKYKIRLVHKPGDTGHESIIDDVRRMDRRLFRGTVEEDFAETYIWFALDSDNFPVGFAALKYLPSEKFGYFVRAGVLEDYRNQGIHKRLIAARITQAKKLRWQGVITYVHSGNPASINALTSRGFKMYVPVRKWAGPDFLYLQLEF